MNPLPELTAIQKLRIFDAHTLYMSRAYGTDDFKGASELLMKCAKECHSCGVQIEQAGAISWEVRQNYQATLAEAVEQGYVPYSQRSAA